MIAIIDYGAGNIGSVWNAVEYAGADPQLVSEPEEILKCDKLILPGVGAAGDALRNIRNSHIDEALAEAVLEKGTPVMGICLGMQMLGTTLFEFGEHQGLGWIPGKVIHLNTLIGKLEDSKLRVPHMGWNDVNFKENAEEFGRRIGHRREFYFAHSYTFRVDDDSMIAATVDYGVELVASVIKDNIFANQFHPEKSQVAGDNLIQAFLDWTP